MLVRMSATLFLVTIAVPQSAAARECIHSATALMCAEYVRNYDGDTITFNIPNLPPLFGENISVRVKGIDAPELRSSDSCEKRLAVIARDFVSDTLLQASRIELLNVERDKYFRILANVKVNGRYLERTLLSRGLAVTYDGGTKPNINWCAMLEDYESR